MRYNTSYKSVILLLLFVMFAKVICFSNGNISPGKSTALAGSSVTISDLWSIYNNQAGLAYLQNTSIGIYHQSGFINEQNLQGISFALPTKTGTIGATYSYYGFSQYNEMQAGIAYAKSFTKYFAIGLKLNYLHTHITGIYGNANTVNFEIGILSEPIENLFIGAHVYNPSHSKMGEEELPSALKLGVSYLFSEKVLLGIETELDMHNDIIFKTGLDYQLIDLISLQAGVASNPNIYSFGIGFHFKDIRADIGFFNHQILGFTPSFAVSYAF